MRRTILPRNITLVFVLALFAVFWATNGSFATGRTYEIYTVTDLKNAAQQSRIAGYEDDTYVLMNDITITAEDQRIIDNSDTKYITFGSSDLPFSGTFDGNGYTISNLAYYKDTAGIVNAWDTGLIAQSDGATIKDLTVDNAHIESIFRGGIVVGKATNTRIENVTVKNSHLSLAAADNIVTLVTDGGVRGGALAGDVFDSVVYNCESENTRVVLNNTSGVAALSGKGLTTAGLVGILNNSTLEYSRVIGGDVKNSYDVAVGALGGSTLYVGGIVGQMQNASKIIDSFSTAELYYYCATYVGVGAGNTGQLGGITAKMDGANNEIYRSHYAGSASSRQYNGLLVVPIIQNNVNVSGLVEVYDGGAVVNSYFKPSASPGVDMKVLGNSSSTSAYGPLTDAQYTDKEYWESVDYDFTGTTRRNTAYNSNHENKWVMDYTKGIPVHGHSAAATFDFPDAGSVSIAPTALMSGTASTNTPYTFAVQGFKTTEHSIDLTATANSGYRFVNWYKVPDVTAWQTQADHAYFDNIFNNYQPIAGAGTNYTDAPTDDNDLFVARYQARVLYHDINGSIIDANTGNSKASATDDDWHYYADTISSVKPTNAPTSSTAKLVGWASIASSEPGGGYSSISAPDLASLKANNQFFAAGDQITRTLDLYPVYTDLSSNITTIFEGNEQDTIDNVSLRDGVGSTSVNLVNDQVVLSVTGANNGAFPDGYRFLGWYDENGYRVSRDQDYTPADLDLTTTHTFTARFEYRVRYYVRAYVQNNGNSYNTSELYDTRWQRYNEPFDNIGSISYMREDISHWGTAHVNHGTTDVTIDAYSGNIVAPIDVYSHNHNNAGAMSNNYAVRMNLDFPGSGDIITNGASTNYKQKFLYNPVSNRYHLLFWTVERNNALLIDPMKSYGNNPMETDTLSAAVDYQGQAFVSADIIFHDKSDNLTTVARRYESPLFMANDTTHTFYYPYIHTSDLVETSTEDGQTISNTLTMQASPSDASMQVNDYAFLGWISSADVAPNSSEWNYIYDVSGDQYTTSNIHKVEPYLIHSSDTLPITEAIDLYPVYAKYNIATTTNVAETGITTGINIPTDPTYTLTDIDGIRKTVTLTADTSTYVTGNSGEMYTLQSFTVRKDNGAEETITPTNGVYQYDIEPGAHYLFIANYQPYIIVFHTNTATTEVGVRDYGDEVGQATPLYNPGANYLFYAWSKDQPANDEYHSFSSYAAFEAANLETVTGATAVTESMELWPVYIQANLTVNSNIDSVLSAQSIDPATVRYTSKTNYDTISLVAQANPYNGYNFVGWYTGYQDDNNRGTLISSNASYPIASRNAVTDTNTYTAVYEQSFLVRYFDTHGNVLYSVAVNVSENRSFVEEYDPGYASPIDATAFVEIDNDISAVNEYFDHWVWVHNGTATHWDDFSETIISQDMDLYPVTHRITAFDSNNTPLTVTDSTQTAQVLYGPQYNRVVTALNMSYTQPTLTIHDDEISYLPTGTTTANFAGERIDLYRDATTTSFVGGRNTDSNGNAVFGLYGQFSLQKQYVEDASSDDVFIFDIASANSPNTVLKRIILHSGESASVYVPYGQYIVTEENAWSWRYQAQSTVNSTSSNTVTVGNQSNDQISFENTLVNSNWLDAASFNDNQFLGVNP